MEPLRQEDAEVVARRSACRRLRRGVGTGLLDAARLRLRVVLAGISIGAQLSSPDSSRSPVDEETRKRLGTARMQSLKR